VQGSDERDFVGGKFLLPTAVRYDGRSKATTEPVKPCTFFNFPYLSLEEHRVGACQDCQSAGPKDHPKRTLLQSRYRLERTSDKDEEQSVTTLSFEEIKKCVSAVTQNKIFNPYTTLKPLLHVPQVWFASLSGGLCAGGLKKQKLIFK
jgi:hypothetical protein